MSNTHHAEFLHLLRSLTASVLITGIVLVFGATTQILHAQLIGPGSTIIERPSTSGDMRIESPELHSSAFTLERDNDMQERLFIGALLILLGCAFHAYWLTQHRRHAFKRLHHIGPHVPHVFRKKMDEPL